ncbi:MAG: M23 family metallopeptidase [Eubacterium sp.]|nr:M23 family metallopeptidase [Eubacterium sp.]
MNKREIISDAFSMLDDYLVREAGQSALERKDTVTAKRNGFLSFAAAAAGIFVAVGAVYAVVNMNLNPIGTGGVVYSGTIGSSTEPSSDDISQPIADKVEWLWPVYGYSGVKEQDGPSALIIYGDGILGENVLAVKDGTVVRSKEMTNKGLCVTIYHGDGYYATYSCMGEIYVDVGQEVSQGDVIGTVGDTGEYADEWLYFELLTGADGLDYHGGTLLDPALYFDLPDYNINQDNSTEETPPDISDGISEVHEFDLHSTLTLEDVNVALKDKTYPEREYQKDEWIWPFDLKLLDKMDCTNATSEDSGHKDMNIVCLDITDVYAVKDGTVILTGESANGWFVAIYNGGGYTSFYSNLGELYVKEGQEVSQCDVIGVTGSFEEQIISNVHRRIPDLHFEINGEKAPVDEDKLWRYYSSETE